MRAIDVECDQPGCRAAGQPRRVQLRLVALGVVELPRLVCARCGAAMRQVGGWRADNQEDNMPKITVHGGPTNAALDGPAAEPGPEPEDLPAGQVVEPLAEPDEGGGERSSRGGSSSTSSGKPSSTDKKNATGPRKPARTTASR